MTLIDPYQPLIPRSCLKKINSLGCEKILLASITNLKKVKSQFMRKKSFNYASCKKYRGASLAIKTVKHCVEVCYLPLIRLEVNLDSLSSSDNFFVSKAKLKLE